jgi:DNA-binding transcriptional MocR family regulator
LLRRHDVPLIEDDVYSELYFGPQAPLCSKAVDKTTMVMHVSSFSKCLAPGYRLGWVAAGRYAEKIVRLKLSTTLATTIPVQIAMAEYLKHGGYDHHLRRLRQHLAVQESVLIEAVERHFPARNQTRPAGWRLFHVARIARAGRCAETPQNGPRPRHQHCPRPHLLGQARVRQLHPPQLRPSRFGAAASRDCHAGAAGFSAALIGQGGASTQLRLIDCVLKWAFYHYFKSNEQTVLTRPQEYFEHSLNQSGIGPAQKTFKKLIGFDGFGDVVIHS